MICGAIISVFTCLTFCCRPKSGSMLLYSRKKVRYRRDGYCWKKRKDGKTTREDHMKLKVQGTEVSMQLPICVRGFKRACVCDRILKRFTIRAACTKGHISVAFHPGTFIALIKCILGHVRARLETLLRPEFLIRK